MTISLLWQQIRGAAKSPGSKGGAVNGKPSNSPTIRARGIFQRHIDTVEDVQFCPSSAQEFCSIGDDSCPVLWDAKTGSAPVVKVEKAHNADLHCVDWNPNDVNLMGDIPVVGNRSSVFGSAAEDGILNIWDYGKVWSH
ncbi:unnamed protein product [Fraxinus pennsylvanica]|uniref:Uncharacterized protein n=1 Tax=Fraxinus pennsylvanica TaxID=56036 RepID=A0AAD2ECJ6_9LAMI|nr:unnamed protein product [Fraxinus pennsylvanica]